MSTTPTNAAPRSPAQPPAPAPFVPAARMRALAPYQRPSAGARIDLHLDANEGPAPQRWAIETLHSLTPRTLRRYPDAAPLERRLAALWGIPPARIVATAGGDDAIDRLCRVALEPGRSILLHSPTFEMIERSARLAGAAARSLDWPAGPFPAAQVIDSIDPSTRLVAIVSPNNPTGAVVPTQEMLAVARVARRAGALVLFDLAYAEYADEDPTPALLAVENAVIVRTFSKARGLAGLRVGYAIASDAVAPLLRAAGGPYAVSGPSVALALASLDRAADSVRDHVRAVAHERAALFALLARLGASPLPSQANFVTARFACAASVRAALADRAVAVRAFTRPESLADALRITTPGDPRAFERLTSALASAMQAEPSPAGDTP